MADLDFVPSQLPQLRWTVKKAFWTKHHGLITSANSVHLPTLPQPGNEPCFTDYTIPHLVEPDRPYEIFYPRLAPNIGDLFGRLAVTTSQLFSMIVELSYEPLPMQLMPKRPKFCLPQDLIGSWARLEDALIDATSYLMKTHPDSSAFPPITYPIFPQCYGYREGHTSRAIATRCAQKARDAFAMLSACLTFALTLWINTDPSRCFVKAFRQLTSRGRNKVPLRWTWALEESYVCNLSAGMRAGGFFDAYSFPWAHFLPHFVAAAVPIWFIWGHSNQGKTLLDPQMLKFFPPNDVIERTRVVFCSDPRQATLDLPPLSFSQYKMRDHEEEGVPEINYTYTELTAYYINRHKTDETIADFVERMEQDRAAVLASETEFEKESRLLRESMASEGLWDGKAAVFFWDYCGNNRWSRVQYLVKDLQSEIEFHGPAYRLYHGHLDKWDLFYFHVSSIKNPLSNVYPYITPHWPTRGLLLTPVGEECSEPPVRPSLDTADAPVDPADIHLLDAFGTPPLNEQLLLNSPHRQLSPERHTTSPAPVTALLDASTVYDEFVPTGRATFSIQPTGSRSDCWDFITLLRFRYGFDALWYTNIISSPAHHNLPSLVKILGYSKKPPALQTYLAIDDCKETIDQPSLSFLCLPLTWDLSPHALSPLELRRKHIKFRVFQKENLRMYVIMADTFDVGDCAFATTSAQDVLLAFRLNWSSVDDLIIQMLRLGVGFYMPRLIEKQDAGFLLQHVANRGLGWGDTDDLTDAEPSWRDFPYYLRRRDEVLKSADGRACRLRGGILARIASEVVTEDRVLLGPAICNNVLCAYSHALVLADDDLSSRSMDIICGVFLIEQKNSLTPTRLSFLPTSRIWQKSGFDIGQWTPDAEEFYVNAMATQTPRISKYWKSATKRYIANMPDINVIAANYIDYWR